MSINLPNTLPLVSIVIPCHNYAGFLGEAVESALHQTYSNVEVLVIDDDSTDDSFETAKNLGVKTVHIQHRGAKTPAHAHNVGLTLAKGDFIIFLGADDKLNSDYVSACINKYYSLNGVGVSGDPIGFVWTGCREFGDSSTLRLPRKQVLKGVFSGYMNPGGQLGAMFVHRSVYSQVGGYDESLGGLEDWDWIIKCLRHGYIGCSIRQPLHYVRIHGCNLTFSVHKNRVHNDLYKRYRFMRLFVFAQKFPSASILFIQNNSLLKQKIVRNIKNGRII